MGVNDGSQYPNLIGNPYAGNNAFQWLNPAAFARPADGQYGDLGRNALHLPGIRNVDASLMKNFNFTESAKLTFRCEVVQPVQPSPSLGRNNTGFSGRQSGQPDFRQRCHLRPGQRLARCPYPATGSQIRLLIPKPPQADGERPRGLSPPV